MHKYLIATAALAAALVLPAAAAAKGPESAAISGPALGRSLSITGNGEGTNGSPLGTLVDLGGFFAQVYGQTPSPTSKHRPNAALGPAYTVTYVLPGPNGIRSKVVQRAYPYAKPLPLTYMRPGQRFWGSRHTVGGWFHAPGLREALVQFGLPAVPGR